MTQTRRTLLAWAPVALYMLVIWCMSAIPHQFDLSAVPFHDKGVHFVEYGTLGFLFAHALRGTWEKLRPRAVFAFAAVGSILWGISDEIHQAFVPGRFSDVHDLAADALGATVGAFVYLVLRQQLRSRSR